MKQILSIIQIVISSLLIIFILIQAQRGGFGNSFGGFGDFYKTKRGAEKIIFIATLILSAFFLLVSIANSLIG